MAFIVGACSDLLGLLPRHPDDRMHIRRHVTMLRDELTALLLRLNELDEKSTA